MEYPHLYMGIRPVNHNKNHVVVVGSFQLWAISQDCQRWRETAYLIWYSHENMQTKVLYKSSPGNVNSDHLWSLLFPIDFPVLEICQCFLFTNKHIQQIKIFKQAHYDGGVCGRSPASLAWPRSPWKQATNNNCATQKSPSPTTESVVGKLNLGMTREH